MKVVKKEYFGHQRKIVSAVTTDSWKNIPHVTYMYEPDVSAFYKEYKKLNENVAPEKKITFNTLMLKVIAEGLVSAPAMNANISTVTDLLLVTSRHLQM